MKYEIKIISEEDTVKSKPYEDLNKAIEIADKMFNDFVNTDFGDEIVVAEENSKDKKYYWANGKTLIDIISIGDYVKISDKGQIYSTYRDFMEKYATKEQCCIWDYGNETINRVSENTKFIVLNIQPHLDRDYESNLAIIKDISNGTVYGRIYLIHTRGLKLYN